jgi:hypothetical protein
MHRIIHRLAAGACLAGLLPALALAEPVPKGIRVGAFTLSPFAGVAGTYDSNVGRASSGEEDDVFLEGDVGLKLGYQARDLAIDGIGFGQQRLYADQGGLDFGAGGEALRLRYGAPERITLELMESWRRVEDQDTYASATSVGGISADAFLDANVRSRRDILEGGLGLGARTTDKTDIGAGYRYNQTDYASTNLFDLTSHNAQLDAFYKVRDKSALVATVLGGLQESDGVDGEAEYAALRLGLQTRQTDRLVFKIGAGDQHYERPEGGDSKDSFHFDGVAAWTATDKTQVQLEGRNGIQLSSVSMGNVVDFTAFRLGIAYRVNPVLALTANGTYRLDDYWDPVPEGDQLVDRRDNGATVAFRADYLIPSKYLRLFAETSYETVDSTVRDYDVARATLGLAIER